MTEGEAASITTHPAGEQVQALLEEIAALRTALHQRRESSPYPWDPAPIEQVNELLARARATLSKAQAEIPPAAPGQQLWRTPTDRALQALDNLQAAITSLLSAEEPRGEH